MRVLVIDDNETFAKAVRRVLMTSDVENVEIETDPTVAVQRIKAGEQFELVLCDVNMPGLNGREVRAAIAEHFTGARPPAVVLITGDDRGEDLDEDVLAKPFRAGDLQAIVHAVKLRAARTR
ncbi:MAG: response regulator [Kofleriaceae bacterium]|nr:response regulator [Kofleriaceae bacterium]